MQRRGVGNRGPNMEKSIASPKEQQTFSLIRNARGMAVVAADNRKPQSFVKYGNHRANRKLSVPCRENLQISYPALDPVRPSILPL